MGYRPITTGYRFKLLKKWVLRDRKLGIDLSLRRPRARQAIAGAAAPVLKRNCAAAPENLSRIGPLLCACCAAVSRRRKKKEEEE